MHKDVHCSGKDNSEKLEITYILNNRDRGSKLWHMYLIGYKMYKIHLFVIHIYYYGKCLRNRAR